MTTKTHGWQREPTDLCRPVIRGFALLSAGVFLDAAEKGAGTKNQMAQGVLRIFGT